ncbi:MAG: hypothetical protein GWP91_10685 [Rhodobacterales bacterium]|nr:hypothetical protein [Rhodobacterales bacterium]
MGPASSICSEDRCAADGTVGVEVYGSIRDKSLGFTLSEHRVYRNVDQVGVVFRGDDGGQSPAVSSNRSTSPSLYP